MPRERVGSLLEPKERNDAVDLFFPFLYQADVVIVLILRQQVLRRQHDLHDRANRCEIPVAVQRNGTDDGLKQVFFDRSLLRDAILNIAIAHHQKIRKTQFFHPPGKIGLLHHAAFTAGQFALIQGAGERVLRFAILGNEELDDRQIQRLVADELQDLVVLSPVFAGIRTAGEGLQQQIRVFENVSDLPLHHFDE